MTDSNCGDPYYSYIQACIYIFHQISIFIKYLDEYNIDPDYCGYGSISI